MPELRQNIITRDWVIISTERSQRPYEFVRKRDEIHVVPPHDPNCPFCPGNESQTLEQTFSIWDNKQWKVRVVPNKFPALSAIGKRERKVDGIYRSISGVGIHEVVIEHPRHDLTIALMEIGDVANVLRAYRQRYAEIRKDPRIEAIIIFKNHGEEAGTSLRHPHSQLAATPVVPTQFRNRIDEAVRYLDDTGDCVGCQTVRDEVATQHRIVVQGKHFVAFLPYAALSPFHLWIFPLRHSSSFDDISDEEIPDLAAVLRTILAKLYFGLQNPAYNFSIRSIPTDFRETDYFHWYLTIIPRITKTAGFEVGSGMFINTVLPEESARFLRAIQLPP